MQIPINFATHTRGVSKRQPYEILLLILLLAGSCTLAACGLLRQQVATPTPQVVHVTADEIALAMQEDHFYSDYNPDALMVQGVVNDVRQANNDYLLELATQINTKVLCDFGTQAPNAKKGDTIEVYSPDAHAAQRQNNAVLLVDCSIP
jgi:hypothetical protein